MRVLITGNMGYVGSTLSRVLRKARPDAELHGFDNAYFAHSLTGAGRVPEAWLDVQHFGDVRRLTERDLEGYDAVVQLAAVSNDPMGARFARVTHDINEVSTISLARAAARSGVGHFVFASSCSVYGMAEGAPRREGDPVNPLTEYAKSKIGAERGLQEIDTDMVITALRFSTACGMSDRLRLDLVLNDFVASALSTGRLDILSDGTPWRPLIDTADMGRAIDWAIDREADRGGRVLIVNVGSDDRNHRVRDMAEAVASAIPGTEVQLLATAPADSRSYRVDFGLYRSLAPDHQPQMTLRDSIGELVEGLNRMGFSDPDFRSSSLMRLQMLQAHVAAGRLDSALVWQDDAVRASSQVHAA